MMLFCSLKFIVEVERGAKIPICTLQTIKHYCAAVLVSTGIGISWQR